MGLKTSNGNSGGLLICWKKFAFQQGNTFSKDGYIGVQGFWGHNKTPCLTIKIILYYNFFFLFMNEKI
jgi:hypothetical protein